MFNFFKVSLVTFFVLQPSKVVACASCGSGGDDPMVLYPWEKWKAYMGFARTGEFERLDGEGQISGEYGPQTRNTTTVSFGHSYSPKLFATVTAPYIVNKRREYQLSGWGDPYASIRYTMVTQTMANELIPQVQWIGSYRAGQATSIYNYEDQARLDVRGSGVPEGRLGVDIWNGMSDWKYGFAQTITSPLDDIKTEFGVVRPGVGFRSTATFGYGWTDSAKVVAGINREYVTAKSVDGQTVSQSDSLGHGAFLSADAKAGRNTSLKFTWSRTATLFANRNTSRNQTVTMAMMRSF